MNRHIKALTVTYALLHVAGCDPETDASFDEIEERQTLSSSCDRWRCGYNAAEINGESLSALNVDGKVNADGVKIVGFVSPLNLLGFKLTLDRDEIVANGGLLGKLTGSGLVGSTILIKLASGLVVPVLIAKVESVPSWAEGAAPITAYTLIYVDLDNPLGQSNVCTGTLADPLTAAVTLIGGETYNDDTKTVNPNQTGWFTLACAGSAAAKMKLMNYGPNSNFDGFGKSASVLQRQGTLKMITADYCGDGVSYTATGTPLLWKNRQGTVSPDPAATVVAFEAAWGTSGATCLDTPRRPDLAASLHCSLPACTHARKTAAEWITMIPGEE